MSTVFKVTPNHVERNFIKNRWRHTNDIKQIEASRISLSLHVSKQSSRLRFGVFTGIFFTLFSCLVRILRHITPNGARKSIELKLYSIYGITQWDSHSFLLILAILFIILIACCAWNAPSCYHQMVIFFGCTLHLWSSVVFIDFFAGTFFISPKRLCYFFLAQHRIISIALKPYPIYVR